MDLTSSPLPYESLSYSVMADSLHYPPATHYVPPSYFSQLHASGHLQVTVPTPRQDTTTQRKRPKYTRSKTGCLTCRAKKIKCDESKPNCLRCTHGQRECTWPEGVPARKKPTPRKEHTVDGGYDTRPSTAGSSGVSDASTPPTRDITPPKREPVDAGLPPLVSRRHSEPVIQVPMAGDLAAVRRQSVAAAGQGYPMHPNSHSSHASHTQMLPVIPEMSSPYSAHQHYHNSSYSASHQYPQAASLALPRITSQHDHLRSVDAHLMSGHWSSPSLLTPVDPLEPFFPSVQERNLVGHSSPTVHNIRYQ